MYCSSSCCALIVSLASVLVLGAVVEDDAHEHAIRARQLSLADISLECVATFIGLEAAERSCLTDLGEELSDSSNSRLLIELNVEQLNTVCRSASCRDGFVKLLAGCEADIRKGFSIASAVDLSALFSLLCVRSAASNGNYCYHELEAPLLMGINDPLVICPKTKAEECAASCKTVLRNYTATCCLVSYLAVHANTVNQRSFATSGIWKSCGLPSPALCDQLVLPQVMLNTGDDSNDSNTGTIAGAVVGGLVIIGLLIAIVILATLLVVKYKSRSKVSVNKVSDKVILTEYEESST